MKTILLIVIGYLLGSIPTGVLIARRLNPDLNLRQVGSGNIGATNVTRALGWKWGALTMLGDCLKGFLPVLLARWWGAGVFAVALTALAAFLGHIYPIYLKMKGGKGVATSLGVWLAISPPVALLSLGIWGSAAIITRSSSAGALSAAIALPIIALGVNGWARCTFFMLALIISATIFYTHRQNIKQLIEGNRL